MKHNLCSGWALRLTPETRWGGLVLHVLRRGTLDPHPHDHPWDYWVLPLISYEEEWRRYGRGTLVRRAIRAFRVHYRSAEYAHRVVQPTHRRWLVNLVWHGPRRRSLGFWVDGAWWVHWRQYLGLDGVAEK